MNEEVKVRLADLTAEITKCCTSMTDAEALEEFQQILKEAAEAAGEHSARLNGEI